MIRTPIGHAATRILREVEAMVRIGACDREKPIMIVEEVRSTDWASVTFVGQRHEFDLRLDGERDAVAAAMVRLADDLAEHEISIAGQFIAEIRVAPGDVTDGAPALSAGHISMPLCIAALVLRD
jgi:hypothetical protein